MIFFAIETARDDVVRRFVDLSRVRLSSGLFHAFEGGVRYDERKDSAWCIVYLEPVFPPLWRYVSLVAFVCLYLIIGGLSFWLLLCLLPMLFEVVLWRRFQMFLFVRGLRRDGYAGPVVTVSYKVLLRYLFDGSG